MSLHERRPRGSGWESDTVAGPAEPPPAAPPVETVEDRLALRRRVQEGTFRRVMRDAEQLADVDLDLVDFLAWKRERERLWLSPACLDIAEQPRQLDFIRGLG